MAWNLTGSIVALVTPFNEDGKVSYDALRELIDFQIENGTDGILLLGTTGESSTMSHEEDEEVLRFAMAHIAGRIPVIAGSGSNSTQTQLEKSIAYDRLGVDGLLLISPYYNKANEEGMYQHFKVVADAVKTPCILYNVPGRTGCSIPVSVVARLSNHPNIVGIKEASGDMSYAMNIAKLLSDEFFMYSGNDDIIVPIMSVGGKGVISVLANVCPKQTHDMTKAYLSGDTALAVKMQLDYLDLIHKLFIEVNPIPVKTALNLMGKNAGGFRLPLFNMTDANMATLRESMSKVGLL